MFDSKQYNNVFKAFQGSSVAFVFYDRFTKKFGPLNVCSSIGEVVYTACNYLKSVEDKNISLSHIDVYVVGTYVNLSYSLMGKIIILLIIAW